MIRSEFLEAYLRKLKKLRHLIDSGLGESEIADEFRDRLRGNWLFLTLEEQKFIESRDGYPPPE